MAANLLDVFSDDAFSTLSLTDAFNNVDHVPGRAGELAFVGVGNGIPTTDVAIEYRDQALTIIPTSPRGATAPKEVRDKAKMVKLAIPHVALDDTINAASIQNVRAFGTGDLVEGAQIVVNEQLTKISLRHDLTLEHMRLGALKGKILDADDTEILDLYATFGVSEPDPIVFPSGAASAGGSLRATIQGVIRQVQRSAKMLLPGTAQVWALCGDEFFDELVSHPDVVTAFQGWTAAQQRLADNAMVSAFPLNGMFFENYRGTDGVTGEEASDGELTGEVGIATGECRIFLTGVPGLYTEKYAPSDFLDTANTIGLPRYAKLVPDNAGRRVDILTEMNPLPICLRPATLLKGSFA